jgi:uncharacterized protein Usg
MLIRRPALVTINIVYYRPDYQSLIQEFIWSTLDHVPELHRTQKFLHHWHHNIDAVIKEILLAVAGDTPRRVRNVDEVFTLN